MKNVTLKKLSFFFVFCLTFSILNAQPAISDSVFLKNGNVITGRIKKFAPNEYVKIDTRDGVFFFVSSDINKLAIHTFNQSILTPDLKLVEQNQKNQSNNSSDDIYIDTQYTDTVKFKPLNRSKLNDYFPVNLFFVQSSLEISSITSPFIIYGQAKFQAIYTRRFIPDYAFGLGTCLRYIDFSSFAKVIFIDIRTVRTKLNNFTSVSVNPGIVFYEGSTGFNLNLGYNYAKRLQKNLFFTIGFDLNYQSNTYASDYSGISGSINPGVSIGLAF